MRSARGTHIRGRRRWVGLVVALVCALPLVGLNAAPAFAARPGRAGYSWVTAQTLQGGPTVALQVRWPRVRGATSYEITFAQSYGSISSTEVQGSPAKRTVRVRATRSATQGGLVRGLRPGVAYCFQIRGRNSSGYGYRGGIHCKITERANRARPVPSVPLVVGTFNTCSNACASTLGAWSFRGPRIRDRIRQMNVGSVGRPVDVVALQEATQATPYLRQQLAPTFTQGCVTGDGTGQPRSDNQSLFVRTATYEVVPGTAGGTDFAQMGNQAHGACWVKVRERTSGREVVVVSVHLWPFSDAAADRKRAVQMDLVADAVNAAFPGATIVYAGDFNSTRNRATDAPGLRLGAEGRDDAYDQAALYLSAPYRNSVCGTSTTPRTSWRWGDHVDRVFAPPGVHVASWEVDYRMSGSRYVTPVLSDHNPVLVTLAIPAT